MSILRQGCRPGSQPNTTGCVFRHSSSNMQQRNHLGMKKLLPSSPKSYLVLTSTLLAAKGGRWARARLLSTAAPAEHPLSPPAQILSTAQATYKVPGATSTRLAAITGWYFTAKTKGFGCLLLKPSFVSLPYSRSSKVPVGGVT